MGEGYFRFRFDRYDREKNGHWLIHLGIVLGSVAVGIGVNSLGLRGGFGCALGSMAILHWRLPTKWTGIDKKKEHPVLVGSILGTLMFLIGANLLFPKK